MNASCLTRSNTSTLVEEFIRVAEESAEYQLTSRGQLLWQQLQAIAGELSRRGAKQDLIGLCDGTAAPIRYAAAALCLAIAPDAARKALIALSEDRADAWYARQAALTLALSFPDQYQRLFGTMRRELDDIADQRPALKTYLAMLRGEPHSAHEAAPKP